MSGMNFLSVVTFNAILSAVCWSIAPEQGMELRTFRLKVLFVSWTLGRFVAGITHDPYFSEESYLTFGFSQQDIARLILSE